MNVIMQCMQKADLLGVPKQGALFTLLWLAGVNLHGKVWIELPLGDMTTNLNMLWVHGKARGELHDTLTALASICSDPSQEALVDWGDKEKGDYIAVNPKNLSVLVDGVVTYRKINKMIELNESLSHAVRGGTARLYSAGCYELTPWRKDLQKVSRPAPCSLTGVEIGLLQTYCEYHSIEEANEKFLHAIPVFIPLHSQHLVNMEYLHFVQSQIYCIASMPSVARFYHFQNEKVEQQLEACVENLLNWKEDNVWAALTFKLKAKLVKIALIAAALRGTQITMHMVNWAAGILGDMLKTVYKTVAGVKYEEQKKEFMAACSHILSQVSKSQVVTVYGILASNRMTFAWIDLEAVLQYLLEQRLIVVDGVYLREAQSVQSQKSK